MSIYVFTFLLSSVDSVYVISQSYTVSLIGELNAIRNDIVDEPTEVATCRSFGNA